MDKIYSDLYDITSRNMQSVGKQLTMKKDTFMFKQRSTDGVFDVSLCGDCDNASFLQIAYLGLLGRMPDPGAVTKWMEKANLAPAEFRSQLLERITASEEYAKRDVKIVNNIYNTAIVSSGRKVGRYDYKVRAVKQKAYRLVKKVYMKVPERGRKMIKKVLGR